MSLTTCNIHFTQRSGNSVYLSRALRNALQMENRKTVTIKVGQKQTQCPIRTLKKQGKHLYIPTFVRNLLKIPRSGNCYIQFVNGREIQLGPVIGILTSSANRSPSQPFGRISPLIQQYLKAGADRAFYFAFSLRDINWQQATISGYFNSSGGWVKRTVPLPNVVYNRLTSRRVDFSDSIENKERFVRNGIPIFNWSYFNKSDVYRLLEDEPESKYVPESHENPPPEKIKEMLEKYQVVYLKPTGGSLGKGIFKLTYQPSKGYFCRFRRNGKNVLLRFNRFSRLIQVLNRQDLRRYIIQQGIRLIEIDNCPIDFRFHMNKNGQNQWVPVGIGAKKAGRGSVTTHIKNGGQLLTPESVLARFFGQRADEMLEKTKHVTIKLCEAIARKYPHPIGELGFDIGIDRNENIWMFEANAKPGRSIFKHPMLKAQGTDTLKHIFNYSLYLSNFQVKEDA